MKKFYQVLQVIGWLCLLAASVDIAGYNNSNPIVALVWIIGIVLVIISSTSVY